MHTKEERRAETALVPSTFWRPFLLELVTGCGAEQGRFSVLDLLGPTLQNQHGCIYSESSSYPTHTWHLPRTKCTCLGLLDQPLLGSFGTGLPHLRKRSPLGPYGRPMPGVLGGSWGGGRFLTARYHCRRAGLGDASPYLDHGCSRVRHGLGTYGDPNFP